MLVTLCGGAVASASTVVYYNQAQWQAAVDAESASVANVSLNDSSWTDTLQLTNSYTNLQSKSAAAGITINSGYGKPGFQNNSALGHVADGIWTDTQGKYGSSTFNFSDSLVAFGGDFDVTNGTGLDFILSDGSSFHTPGTLYNGFVGVVSDTPFSSVLISYMNNGYAYPFGDSYTLSDLQVGNDPVSTPEPDYRYASAGLVLFIACYAKFRSQKSPQ